jgi:hypothetical protein
MFESLKKRSALKKYVFQLTPELVKGFGGVSNFTVGQVTKTVQRLKLSEDFIPYAHSMFCSNEEFKNHYQSNNDIKYENLRKEVSELVFEGNMNFKVSDLIKISSKSSDTGSFHESGIGMQGGGSF